MSVVYRRNLESGSWLSQFQDTQPSIIVNQFGRGTVTVSSMLSSRCSALSGYTFCYSSFTVPFSTGFVISLYAPFACVWSSTWVLATWHTVSWSMTQPRGVRWRYSGVDSFVIWKILWWQALENKGRFWKRIRIIKLSVNFEIYNNRLNC